ncbi:hypothetical protein SmJEL517_g04416 [Synchytrium microbalum]|uniref:Aromatic-L-amino-acid decarboxylase n=1 Tax=Synchytrium microbalum TaxID=1806994 RepID=A0A507BZ76_9FUNG|nr:uncharacterized protein SmJEL517_g04416 [Synchytrium microbalum]TPX32431.1 hypothetical protein SmJEL517_g04416 [Synchytrium microbalum]
MDVKEFRKRGHEAVERIAKYYEELEAGDKYKVLSDVKPGYLKSLLPEQAPEEPEAWESISSDFENKIMPGVTHWQHPSFFAFYPANSSFPGILGDMYSSMINCIAFNWQTSPSCTELETVTLDWVAKLCNLDAGFLSTGKGGGVIQGSASEAVLVAVIAARERVLGAMKAKGASEAELANAASRLVAYGSTQTHSCTKKACLILNLKFKSLDVDTQYRLRGDTVKAAVEQDLAAGLIPFFVTGTIGTTSSGAVDAIPEIVKAIRPHADSIWLHIDAAYAGSAMTCAEHQYHLAGTSEADSFNFNAHKWMLTNFDCSLFYVKDRSQLTNALSLTPAYLRNAASDSGLVFDYRDWQLPLGRRFRSLKLWFVLRTYGAKGIRAHIRMHVDQAQLFHKLLLSRTDLFKVFTPPSFALMTFQVQPAKGQTISEATQSTLETCNASGKMLLTPTELDGQYVIRFVPGSRLTENHHIEQAFKFLTENKVFVKWAWAWTATPILALMVATAVKRHDNPLPAIAKSLLRWTFATSFLMTQWFLGSSILDRILVGTGGECADPIHITMHHCRKHGHQWFGGFDVSGHCLILIHASLFICEELWNVMYPVRDSANGERVPVNHNVYQGPLERALTTLLIFLLFVWYIMLLGISVLNFNRPASRNALGKVMMQQFREALAELKFDSTTRVVILRSLVDKVFCAGADLKERQTMPIHEVAPFVHSLRSSFNEVEALPMPTIAAIDGAALGGGLELALAADLRVAGGGAKLGLPETRLAIIPGAGGTQRLPRFIGVAKAKELIFTCRTLNAKEAESLGIVNHAVAASAYDKALELAREILPQGPIALRMAKIAVTRGLETDMTTGMAIEEACYAQVVPTEDRLEGLKAFREKRVPVYHGR